MKRKLWLVSLALTISGSYCIAQKIIMKIASSTAQFGEEVRALEFQINADPPSTIYGPGKAQPGTLMIKKTNDVSTGALFNGIVKGTIIPEVLFEYYDTDITINKTPYYTITLGNANVLQLYWLSPECPTCLKLEHQVGFVFKTMKTVDNVTGQTRLWNIATGTIQ